MNQLILLTIFAFMLSACSTNKQEADAYGNFEATETIIAAEGNGVLKQFDIQEGQTLQAGDTIGYIDTTQLHLQKQQLQAQIASLRSSLPNVGVQLQVIDQQLDHARQEQERLKNLLVDSAATQKQKDDIDAQVKLLLKKHASLQSSLSVQTRSLLSKIKPLQLQIAQIEKQLQDCLIINPVSGIVLTKFSEPHEVAAYGKPLYTISDLSEMTLRAYVTESQLPGLKIGDTLIVRSDAAHDGYDQWRGFLTWISDKSEFTPKEIQTKEERANRVYAIKVLVKNDGKIKIGMPGEVFF